MKLRTLAEVAGCTVTGGLLIAAGWHLFSAAQVGWGIRLVDGLVGYDGMCRPNQFQGFVFADGQFVGTISPAPMNSRTEAMAVSDTRTESVRM